MRQALGRPIGPNPVPMTACSHRRLAHRDAVGAVTRSGPLYKGPVGPIQATTHRHRSLLDPIANHRGEARGKAPRRSRRSMDRQPFEPLAPRALKRAQNGGAVHRKGPGHRLAPTSLAGHQDRRTPLPQPRRSSVVLNGFPSAWRSVQSGSSRYPILTLSEAPLCRKISRGVYERL